MFERTRYSQEEFIQAVKTSTTILEVLTKLGLAIQAGNYRTFHKYQKLLGLDTSHFDPHKNCTGAPLPSIPLKKVLVKDSTYNTYSLKKRLLKRGILKERCVECGTGPIWNNKPLALHLDHINGLPDDHRLENLQILCPNCHSQTETFCGKKRRKRKKPQKKKTCTECGAFCWKPDKCPKCNSVCESCGKKCSIRAKRCRACFQPSPRPHKEKIDWPSDQALVKLVRRTNFLQAGKHLGVSDNAVRKRLRKRGFLKKGKLVEGGGVEPPSR